MCSTPVGAGSRARWTAYEGHRGTRPPLRRGAFTDDIYCYQPCGIAVTTPGLEVKRSCSALNRGLTRRRRRRCKWLRRSCQSRYTFARRRVRLQMKKAPPPFRPVEPFSRASFRTGASHQCDRSDRWRPSSPAGCSQWRRRSGSQQAAWRPTRSGSNRTPRSFSRTSRPLKGQLW